MAISRFDEGTLSNALWAYWSGAESNITKTGSVVNSVDSAYGLAAGATLGTPEAASADISHDGTTMVGLIPAFYDANVSSVARLHIDIANSSRPIASTAFTVVCVIQRNTANLGLNTAYVTRPGGGANASINRNGDFYAMTSQNDGEQVSTMLTVDAPDIVTLVQSDQVNGSYLRVTSGGGQVFDYQNPRTDRLPDELHFFTRPSSASNFRGKIAIMLMYERELTSQEITDIEVLCQYWIDNGEAPPTGLPSGTFGTVATNDDPSVTWQWEESSDGVAWANVGTILTDTTGATTNKLDVNSAHSAANGTQVRCRATNANEPAGVVSDVATLTVTS